MDTLELKLSLIEQLKTIDDKKLLTQIKNLISIATEKKEKRYPAQMTIDELKEVLRKSSEESKQGLGMTTEELRKRHPLCK
jgi:predicted Ser/Thr protein kinase